MSDDYDYYFQDQGGPERAPGFVRGSDTSESAARSLTSRLADARRVLDLYETGDFTRDEIVHRLGLTNISDYSSITPRITELVKAGCLVGTALKRKTSRGRAAVVLTRVPGTSLETFKAWCAGNRSSSPSQSHWRKAVDKAMFAYALDPSPQNGGALLAIALEGRAFAPSVSSPQVTGEDIDVMAWAREP